MVTAVWSMKGGSGVTSVVCLLALAQAERAEPTMIVDLDGDIPAVLGMSDSDEPGLADWYATPSRSPGTLARIRRELQPDLHAIVRGDGDLVGEPDALMQALAHLEHVSIIDCGMLASPIAAGVAGAATQRLIVTRPCYLALRASRETPVSPTGVVMIEERGRSLGRSDIEAVVGAPVIAQVAVDPAIARAIDAGLMSSRLPRTLVRSMGSVIEQ